MHTGNGDLGDLGKRFYDCFVHALDDAGFPDDPAFRAAMQAYVRWAVDNVLAHPDEDADIAPGIAIPRWGWNGRQSD